jgi:hypothetical protein
MGPCQASRFPQSQCLVVVALKNGAAEAAPSPVLISPLLTGHLFQFSVQVHGAASDIQSLRPFAESLFLDHDLVRPGREGNGGGSAPAGFDPTARVA